MINANDIITRLNVSEQQVIMAIYSGRLPKPNEEGSWNAEYVENYLVAWETSLNKRRKQSKVDIYTSRGLTFSKHTR